MAAAEQKSPRHVLRGENEVDPYTEISKLYGLIAVDQSISKVWEIPTIYFLLR